MRRSELLAIAMIVVVIVFPTTVRAGGSSFQNPVGRVSLTSTEGRRSPLKHDENGVAIIGDAPIQVHGLSESEAMAFDQALDFALANPDDLGYPWIDPAVGVLELAAVNDRGVRLAQDADFKVADDVATRVTETNASVAQLQAIAEQVTHLVEEGLADSELIYMTEPDQRDNLIVITTSKQSDALMKALADRFDPAMIGVRVRAIDGVAGSDSRASDAPPFWGGAKLNTPSGYCTTGFAWSVGSVAAMLTAAHCAPSGGNVGYPSYPNAGAVQSATEENWNTTYGTRYYTGQSTYRGDVALIRYTSSYSSAARIFNGSQTSSSSAVVAAMNSRHAQLGDAICNDGITTGPWCGAVLATGSNILYAGDGPNVWARNVVEGYAGGNTCPTHGDSGSGVYQNRSDGKVTAFGILSGSLPLVVSCHIFFTDIRDANSGLPGSLKTG